MRLDMNRLMARGHDNVTLDGVDLGRYFELLEIDVQPYPDLSAVTTDVPGRVGSHLHGRTLGTRDVDVRLAVRAASRDPLAIDREWRRMSPLLLKDHTVPLHLDDEHGLDVMAVSVSDLERVGDRGIVTVTFRAFDPRFHGPEHSVALSATATRFRTVTQCETWPTVTVTGASGTLQVRNRTTGDQVVVPGVTSSATIVVDMESAKVHANGAFKAVDMNLTDFWSLLPDTEYEVSLSSGTGTLTYREMAL